jgi:hypothetical protein
VIHLNREKKTSPSACSETGAAPMVALSDGRLQLLPDTGLKLFIPSFFSVGAGIMCPSFHEPSSDVLSFQAFFLSAHEISSANFLSYTSIIFSICLILPAALGPEEQRRNKKFVGNGARPVRKADKLSAICDPIV